MEAWMYLLRSHPLMVAVGSLVVVGLALFLDLCMLFLHTVVMLIFSVSIQF